MHFKTYVHYITTYFEMLEAILLVSLSLHVIVGENDSNNQISISTLLILALLSLVLTVPLLYHQHLKIERQLMSNFANETLTSKVLN